MDLPPLKQIDYSEATIRQVYNTLTSLVVGHHAAHTTYRFYEVIDEWLGPWGDQGYPIAYGKFYNIVFNTNKKLAADQTASEWVRRTTILLQQALRDYIIHRMRSRTLAAITEPELRAAAFKSHATCYTEGGLTDVLFLAPELLTVIALLPMKEFDPTGPNFAATVSQVFETMGLVAKRSTSRVAASLIGPVHRGLFEQARRRDLELQNAPQRRAMGLSKLGRMIDNGEFDDIAALNLLIERIQRMEFTERPTALLADRIIEQARARIALLKRYYKDMLEQSPEVRQEFERKFGQLLR